MRLVRLTLTAPGSPTQSQAELVHDAIWAHLARARGIEHITATAIPAGIDLAIFLRHDTPEPELHARNLINAACRTSPVLHALHIAV